LAVADTGSGNANQRAVGERMAERHRQRPVDLVLMGGDNIYPAGNLIDVQRTFQEPYRELLRAGQEPAYAFVPPITANYIKGPRLRWADKPFAVRQVEARALLAEAGYTEKRPLKITILSANNSNTRAPPCAMMRLSENVATPNWTILRTRSRNGAIASIAISLRGSVSHQT
jgi:hypothetical protein